MPGAAVTAQPWSETSTESRNGEPRTRPLFDSGEIPRMVGNSGAIHHLRGQIQRLAAFRDVPVLILGETGTGKDLVARTLHALTSPDEPYVALNSAAVPDTMFESEVFGHEAGAFTGAKSRRTGLLGSAGRGTVFLDEIGEMPSACQAKLLRALESRSYRRLGSGNESPLQARVISATHRWPGGESPSIRPDLLYRIAGFTLVVPPLRDREEDVPELAETFLRDFATRHGLGAMSLSGSASEWLARQSWPGNVRQLRRAVEHAAILAHGGDVGLEHVAGAVRFQWPGASDLEAPLPHGAPTPLSDGAEPRSLADVERGMIASALQRHGGNVSRSAAELGIARSTLRDRARRYGLQIAR